MEINDVIQVKLFSYMGNQLGLNVRHYLVGTKVNDGATLAEIAADLAATFSPLYEVLMTNTAEFVGVSAQRILPTPITAAEMAFENNSGVAGTTPLPQQVSGIITLRTALAGRANRGRVYIPFPDESDNSANHVPEASYGVDLTALAAEFVANQSVTGAAGSNTLVPVVFHRDLDTTTVITGARANGAWATQRRRGFYGRPNAQIIG